MQHKAGHALEAATVGEAPDNATGEWRRWRVGGLGW
jgi:hypothetical protein